jgi:hypothetical protein
MTYRIEIRMGKAAPLVFEGVPLGRVWDQWPWLLFAMLLIENPEFVRLEFVVGQRHVSVAREA